MNTAKAMLRKRLGGGGLPTTTGLGASKKFEDGSGKSIKMEAPLAKAIRSADGFIKATYIWFFISIFFIWGGWTWMRRTSASIVLDCHASGCTLTIQRPYKFTSRNLHSSLMPTLEKKHNTRKTKIEITRDQIVRADNIKWDPASEEIVENYGINSPTYTNQQQQAEEEEEAVGRRPNKPWNQHKRNKKKKKYKYKKNNSRRNGGPDDNGNYDSYIIVLRDPLPPEIEEEEEIDPNESPSKRMQRKMAAQHNTMTHDENSLVSLLAPYIITHDKSDRELSTAMEYSIHPRDFNIGQTRRLARTTVSKINAYTKGRRATCIVRESRPVSWQGLVLLILGIFSVVLCLLLGQFWEDYDPTKHGSYKQRMAEIRKRQEAQKLRSQRRNAGRKTIRRSTASSSNGRVARSSGSDVRMRSNATKRES